MNRNLFTRNFNCHFCWARIGSKSRNYHSNMNVISYALSGWDLRLCVCVRSWKCNMQKIEFIFTMCTTFTLFHWHRSAIFTIFLCNHAMMFSLYDSLCFNDVMIVFAMVRSEKKIMHSPTSDNHPQKRRKKKNEIRP